MEHKPKTLWTSEGKDEHGEPFLTVKMARDYYVYSERAGVDSIFFILHDANNPKKFGLISESKPPMDERLNDFAMLTTAFGGSMEPTLSPVQLTQKEVAEESGYEVEEDSIIFLGSTLVSSQLSQIAHGFLVDVTGTEKTLDAEYELETASEEFKHNKVVWMDELELAANNDWKSCFIMLKLLIDSSQIKEG